MTVKEHLEKLLKECLGVKIANFKLVEGGPLILYLQNDEEVYDGKRLVNTPLNRLWINCTWRISRAKRIIVCALDSTDLILSQLNRLIGKSLSQIEANNEISDLIITLDDSSKVEIFCDAVDCEPWVYRKTNGYRLGVGERLQPFEKYETPDSEQES